MEARQPPPLYTVHVYYIDGAQPSEQPSSADDLMQVPDAARHAPVEPESTFTVGEDVMAYWAGSESTDPNKSYFAATIVCMCSPTFDDLPQMYEVKWWDGDTAHVIVAEDKRSVPKRNTYLCDGMLPTNQLA